MKKNNNLTLVSYAAPSIEVAEVVVEAGFAESTPGATNNPWENDNDGLEC